MRLRESIALGAYTAAFNLLLPLGILVGLPFLLLKEKRRKTVFKRLGLQQFPVAVKSGRPIWVHALSLGELLSCEALMQALRERVQDRPIYLSVSTLSAMQLAEDRFRASVDELFYFPLDLWWSVRRALKRVNPAVIAFIETDIWPGFQHQTRAARIPVLLVNGRLSPDSQQAYRRFRSLFVPALNTFRTIYPQSSTEAQRYRDVGVQAERLGYTGNLKFDVADALQSTTDKAALRNRLGVKTDDLVLLAGSTHPGEEQAVLDAFEKVRQRIGLAKLIIVPRHPARGAEVLELARRRRLVVHAFTSGKAAAPWDVTVVDAIGVLSKLYTIARVSFVGGSLVPKGGQNPLESAAGGCPVVFGSDMSDFPDIAMWLVQHGAATQIEESAMLADAWLEILSSDDRWRAMSRAGRRVVEENRGATDTIVEEIVMSMDDVENSFEDRLR